jgi:Flp pilus assembly protein TadD
MEARRIRQDPSENHTNPLEGSMKVQQGWLPLLAAGLMLGACGKADEEKPATPAAQPPAAEAPKAETTEPAKTDQEPVSLNWKDERKAKAMAGLVYASGRAEIDPAAAATKVSVQDPNLAERMHQQAASELAENLVIEAIDSYTRAVLLQPDHAAHYSGLASAFLVKRMVPEAIASLRVALDLEPNSGAYHFQMGDALVRSNEREAAIVELQKSIELDATNATAHERLAVQHYYLGDHGAAWREVHACEDLGASVAPQFRVLLAQVAVEPSSK